jgi:hypothetical protein
MAQVVFPSQAVGKSFANLDSESAAVVWNEMPNAAAGGTNVKASFSLAGLAS